MLLKTGKSQWQWPFCSTIRNNTVRQLRVKAATYQRWQVGHPYRLAVSAWEATRVSGIDCSANPIPSTYQRRQKPGSRHSCLVTTHKRHLASRPQSGFPFSDALQLRAHVRQPGYSGGVACRRADAVWATASKAMVAAMTISPVFMVKSSNAVGGVGDRETCRTFVPHGLWQTRDTANHWILCQSLMIGLRAHNASLS